MKEMLLIDGNSMLFRAYYATAFKNMMKTKDGIYTNAIFAFSNMLNKAIGQLKPDYVVVAFDKGKHTFRHDIYPEYKGGRKKAPDELVPQFQLVRDFLDAYEIPYFEMDDIEADDLIGSIVKKYRQVNIKILSSDRDLLQLIDDTTKCLMMKKGISDMLIADEKYLAEEMQITPAQITDLKGLMGDTADNIIGVPGIGPKTATKLLNQYHTVENLYDHIDELKGKQKEKLIENKESAFLSKKLATIKCDVDIDIELDKMLFTPNFKKLTEFYLQYEMNSLANKVNNLAQIFNQEVNISMDLKADSNKELDKINIDQIITVTKVEEIEKTAKYFIHFEIDDRNYHNLDYHYALIQANKKIYMVEDFNLLKDFFSSDIEVTLYDIKHLYHLFAKYEIKVKSKIIDLKILGFIADSNSSDFKKLLEIYQLSQEYDYEAVYFKRVTLTQDLLLSRSLEMLELYHKLETLILDDIKKANLIQLYEELELPLARVLYKMEAEGINCSYDILDSIAIKVKAELEQIETEVYQLANEEFNLNSPKQLGVILFDKLELKAGKKRSTAQDKLEKLVDQHPIIPLILKYRKLTKIYSTYADGLKKYIVDGKIHTVFNQCLAATSRLSSSDPNLQNISVRDKQAKEIRKAFIASDGCSFVSCDYSQVELRMLAYMANEKHMIDTFNHNIDIHSQTAAKIMNKDISEVNSSDRRKAKAVNFGIVYGISAFGLAKQINVTNNEAKEFIDNYLETFPRISIYMQDVVKKCQENGYVETILKHRRYIKDINASNKMVAANAQRAAMNTPIQGSAADIIKLAMLNVDKRLTDLNLKSKLIIQVHDELIFEVPNDELEIMKKIILEEMEGVMKLPIKLEADLSVGKSWFDTK